MYQKFIRLVYQLIHYSLNYELGGTMDKRFVIPSVMATTLIMAEIFAFVSVERASTVHNTIQNTILDGRVISVHRDLSGFDGLMTITGTTPLDIRVMHVMVTMPVINGANDNCQTDDASNLAFPAGVNILYEDGFIDNTQQTGDPMFPPNNVAKTDVSFSGEDVNLCVMHQTVTPTGISHHVWVQNTNIGDGLTNGTAIFATISQVEG